MLTDYMVTCPHTGCHWTGSLLPKANRDAWKTALPTTHDILFECPRCNGDWHARVIGDDAVPLSLEDDAEVLELAGTA